MFTSWCSCRSRWPRACAHARVVSRYNATTDTWKKQIDIARSYGYDFPCRTPKPPPPKKRGGGVFEIRCKGFLYIVTLFEGFGKEYDWASLSTSVACTAIYVYDVSMPALLSACCTRIPLCLQVLQILRGRPRSLCDFVPVAPGLVRGNGRLHRFVQQRNRRQYTGATRAVVQKMCKKGKWWFLSFVFSTRLSTPSPGLSPFTFATLARYQPSYDINDNGPLPNKTWRSSFLRFGTSAQKLGRQSTHATGTATTASRCGS